MVLPTDKVIGQTGHTDDHNTVATAVNANAAAVALKLDTATASATYAGKSTPLVVTPGSGPRVEIQKDASPLDYSSTRASFVIQHRDTATLAANAQAPGAVFQFTSTADGHVVPASKFSDSIWTGLFSTAVKTGDGSMHAFTATGELHAIGAVGYNELGGFQAELTNVASTLGNISGVEMLLKDSPDAGTTKFDTAMKAVVGRLAKYHTGRSNRTTAFFASSEGTVTPDSILSVNGTPAAPNAWQSGIDLSGASFASGAAAYLPNNTNLSWLDSGNTARPIFGVSSTNISYLRPGSAAAYIDLETYAGASALKVDGTNGRATLNSSAGNVVDFQASASTVLSVQSDGTLAWGTGPTTLGVGAAGGASAMPTPAGYLYIYIGGAAKRLAYFN